MRGSGSGAIYYHDHEFGYGGDPEGHVTHLAGSITAFIEPMIEDERDDPRMKTKSERSRYIAGSAALLLVICLFRSCSDALFIASREVYLSPQGTNTIIIEYDHVCRPYVYQKAWYGKREIWTYPGSGFMETVSFDVEWLSEDQFRMTYDDKNDRFDEVYIITITE